VEGINLGFLNFKKEDDIIFLKIFPQKYEKINKNNVFPELLLDHMACLCYNIRLHFTFRMGE